MEQVSVLTRRVVGQIAIYGPDDMRVLLTRLREIGTNQQVAVVVDHLPVAGRFDLFTNIADQGQRFNFGREPDGTPAAPWTRDDLT